MRVGEQAKVTKLERPTDEDRTAYVGREGLLVRRLNVAWTPGLGELWELRFDDGEQVVFSESELAAQQPGGGFSDVDIEQLKGSWGDAPRRPSMPFRRFGAGSGSAPAFLALLVLCLAGVLLLWAAVAEGSALLGIAGVVLVLIGVGATAALVS